jgi:acetyl/propionyl-CoA carboxylase alpha subunit
MLRALEQFSVAGIDTTIAFQHFAVSHPDFMSGKVNTHLVEDLIPQMLAAVNPRQSA